MGSRNNNNNNEALSVTMSLRCSDIERDICCSEERLSQLCRLAELTRSVRRVPRALGLQGHPWLRSLPAGTQSSAWVALLSAIIYRCDGVTAFESHAASRRKHEQGLRAQAKAARPFIAQEKQKTSLEAVLNRAATEHLRQQCEVNSVYSIAIQEHDPTPALGVTALRTHLQRPMASREPELGNFELDVEADDSALRSKLRPSSGRVSFRIIDTKPSGKKTQTRGVAAGRKAEHHQIAIALTKIHKREDGREYSEMNVGCVAEQQIALVTLQGQTHVWLRENMMVHKEACGGGEHNLMYSITNFETRSHAESLLLSEVLGGLVREVAYNGTARTFTPREEALPLLCKLEEVGLVCRAGDGASDSWQLMAAAMNKMVLHRNMCAGELFLRTPSISKPLADCTTYELCMLLLDRGCFAIDRWLVEKHQPIKV